MTEKIDFLISPEYWVPTTRIVRSWKLIRTAASEWVPWTSGSSLSVGAAMTTKSASPKLRSSSSVGRTSIWWTKSAWLASSQIAQILRE